MFLQTIDIHPGSSASEIVLQNHHTADVFRKYDIEYCCTGRWPLETVCAMKGISFESLKQELEKAGRPVFRPALLAFDKWNIDFLTSYIINVHHQYLKDTLPATAEMLAHFADEHTGTYPYMQEVRKLAETLQEEIFPHMQEEEQVVFPYICQVIHAYESNDSYGKLFVKTLRKPLDALMLREQELISSLVYMIRKQANNYLVPDPSCISHKVVMSRLEELDNDLMQHICIENEILFPRAIAIEKKLLK